MSRFALLLCACAALTVLSACTTSQERSAELASKAKAVAEAKRFRVGKTSRDLVRAQTTLLRGKDASAMVVKITNRGSRPQVVVPIGVDLYDADDESLYTNRVDGLDLALNNIPLAERGTTWWVNNQLPAGKPTRTRVRIGTSRTAVPKAIPRMRVSAVKLSEDEGVAVARGKVENLSPILQRRLTIFAVALKGGRPVAAGRAVVEKLNPKGGKRQRFAVYFTGDPSGAQLVFSAPPSTLGGASQ